MSTEGPTIDDVRQLHKDLLSLTELGLVYAFPSGRPGGPLFKAAAHCTLEEIATAIPYPDLRLLLLDEQQTFLAACN